MKSMKRIGVSVVVLALLVIGIPYLLGMQAKRMYERNIEVIAQQTALPIRSTSYHEGIFTSSALTEFKVGQVTIQLHHKIFHGPIIFDRSTAKPNGLHFGLAWIRHSITFVPPIPEYENLRQAVAEKDLLSWKTLIAFNGDMKNYIYSPAVQHITKEGMSIAWEGMNGEISSDRQYKNFSGALKMPGLKLKTSNFDGGFKELNEDFHSARVEYNLWVGKWTYSLQAAELNTANAKRYELQALNWDSEAKLENQLYQVRAGMQLNLVHTPIGQYGPFVMHAQLINLDPEGLGLLQEQMGKPAVASLEERSEMKAALRKLLLKTPTLVVDNTQLSFPEGEVSVDARLSMGGPNLDAGGTENSGHGWMYMNTLEGTVKALVAPEVLQKFLAISLEKEVYAKPEVLKMSPVEQKVALDKEVALKIEKLKSSGLLTEQGKMLELKFNIEKGNVMANGKAVNAADL